MTVKINLQTSVCFGLVLINLCFSPVHAQTSPPPQMQTSYTYKELLAGFENSPLSQESGAIADAALARVQQAQMRTNPEISLEVENFAGNHAYRGLREAETTIAISKDLELFGRRSARVNIARSNSQAANLQKEIRKLEFASNLAKLFGEAEASKMRLDLAASHMRLVEDDLRIVSNLYEGGREPMLRKVQAETDLAVARGELADLQNQFVIATMALRSFVNHPSPNMTIVPTLLGTAPKTSSSFQIAANPTYRALVELRNTSRFQIESARIDARPNARAYLGARNLNGTSSVAFVGGVSVNVPFFDKNVGNIAASSAELRANETRISAFIISVEGNRNVLLNRQRATDEKLSSLASVISIAEESYTIAKVGFQAGKINLIEVQNARNILLETRKSIISAQLERVRIEAELAQIEGRLPYEVIR